MKGFQARLLFILFFVLMMSAVLFAAKPSPASSAAARTSFEIDFIDVGQGDATLVQCDGHYMLVDGGDSKKSSLIYTYLKKRGITFLDYIVATHPDADHIGGLSGALNYAKARTAYSPVTSHDTKTFNNFLKYLRQQNLSITVPSAGSVFKLGTASVTVLGPIKVSEDTNNSSIVLRIVYGKTSFLLTGDAEMEEENAILDSGQNVKSTVLKVGHHGSRSSTNYRFLREVSPAYAVISVGAENSYGHPAEDTLSRMRDAGTTVFRTDMQGDIVCVSDGKKVTFHVSKNADADTLAESGVGQNASSQSNSVTRDNSTVNDNAIGTAGTKDSVETTYVLNTNTMRFHYPDCDSVGQMKDKNKKTVTESREKIIAMGYQPCENCKP